MVQEIKAYRTKDGGIFENQELAVQHEKRLSFEQELYSLFEDNPYITSRESDAFLEYIKHNGEALYDILKQKYGE